MNTRTAQVFGWAGTKGVRYGTRATCTRCGQDVEHQGRGQWTDRGGNRACCAYVNREGETVRPKGKHTTKGAK
jgi:hypothetical protein